jgi:hypothetical protein
VQYPNSIRERKDSKRVERNICQETLKRSLMEPNVKKPVNKVPQTVQKTAAVVSSDRSKESSLNIEKK